MATHQFARRLRLTTGASTWAIVALLAAPRMGQASIAITVDDLPSALQPSFNTIGHTSSFDANGTGAFTYVDVATISQKWLVRYPLFARSGQTVHDNDTGATQQVALTGYLWLEAPLSLNPLAEPQQFTLYTDKVSPSPALLWPGLDGSTMTLTLPSVDVISGGGFFSAGLDIDLNTILLGSLQILDTSGNPFVPLCLAEGCESSATLQLTYLNYSSGAFTFDHSDTRALAYTQTVIDPFGQTIIQSYYVQPVPEPASAGAVATAILGIGWWSRRRTG